MTNVVVLLGNITKEVELKYSASGVAYVSFTLAVRRQFKDKQTGEYQSDFINCKTFAKSAEFLADYAKKGSKIAVQGSIQTGKYENKEGVNVYTTDVIVNNVTLLDSKKDSGKNQAFVKQDNAPLEITSDELPF